MHHLGKKARKSGYSTWQARKYFYAPALSKEPGPGAGALEGAKLRIASSIAISRQDSNYFRGRSPGGNLLLRCAGVEYGVTDLSKSGGIIVPAWPPMSRKAPDTLGILNLSRKRFREQQPLAPKWSCARIGGSFTYPPIFTVNDFIQAWAVRWIGKTRKFPRLPDFIFRDSVSYSPRPWAEWPIFRFPASG